VKFDPTIYDLVAGTSEHYVDAQLYDFEYRRRRADVNHYRRLSAAVPKGQPILELGCGTGRITVAIARDGRSIVGLDRSAQMLARARHRLAAAGRKVAPRATFLRADMRAFAFGRRFGLVFCPFNTLQHLYTRHDVASCFDRVRDALADGGRFAFDVMNPDLRWLARDPTKRWARTRFRHPQTGVRYEYTTNQTYDCVTQIAHMRIYYEEIEVPPERRRTHVVRLAHRQFFPAELEALVTANGFRIETRWGGFGEEELDDASESQVVVCVRR
jgi:SAM-dependent methyltransferase